MKKLKPKLLKFLQKMQNQISPPQRKNVFPLLMNNQK